MQPAVVSHPLAQCHLTEMRDASTPPHRFRRHLNLLGRMLFLEATRDLPVAAIRVQTPLQETNGVKLAGPMVFVPILRAGLGLLDGILSLVPDACVAHVGIKRNEETAQPQPYYANLPPVIAEADVFLLDPMLATGGSMAYTLQLLLERGATDITAVCVVCAPPGIALVETVVPDLKLFTATIDPALNDVAYIVPGLGDAGDRLFGTK